MGTLAMSFVKIVVADLETSERFYRDALDLKLIGRTTATGSDYAQEECIMSVTGKTDSNMLLLIRYLHRPTPTPGEAWTGFIVSDVDETVAAVEREGGKVVIAAHEVPSQKVKAAIVTDPEGHMIEVVQMLA